MTRRIWALALTVGLPTLVQGYVIGLLTLAIGLTKKPHFDGPVLCTYWRKDRRFTTTIAAWMAKSWHFTERTRFHEWEHVEDYLLDNFKAVFLSACVIGPFWSWWWALGIWGTSGALWHVPNFVAAAIVNKRKGVSWFDALYYYSDHEQDAYSVTKARFDGEPDKWEP